MRKYLYFLFTLFLFVGTANATTYVIAGNGSGSTCSVASPCSMSYVNSNMVAGDTAQLLDTGGNYTTAIAPSASGTSDINMITYEAYPGDTPVIYGVTYGIYLASGQDYIKIDGITFTGVYAWGLLDQGANYNILSNNDFQPTVSTATYYVSFFVDHGSNYNWIHHNKFYKHGTCSGTPPNLSGGGSWGDSISIGRTQAAEGSSRASSYNLLENNELGLGAHNVLEISGTRNVIRNNQIYSYPWHGGPPQAGSRNAHQFGWQSQSYRNLWEGNRIGYSAGPDCKGYQVGAMSLSTNYNVLRYNDYYLNDTMALHITQYAYSDISYNRIYNNTFHANANNPYWDGSVYYRWLAGVTIQCDTDHEVSCNNNVIKNNLFANNPTPYEVYGGDAWFLGANTWTNNYDDDVQGNPLFTNAPTTRPGDMEDNSIPNLTLTASSPAIDWGASLTTVAVADTGTGTSLVVNDASYFQDGVSWGPPGLVSPDWIAVGSTTNTVRISSINYSTNTITLANSISRNDNDPVWLYKKSDGEIVLYGSAPDAGAHEYLAGETDTTPPERYNSTPGSLPAGTTSTTLSLTTNENATCRSSTSSGVSYDSMVNTFDGVGTTSHTMEIGGVIYSDSFNRSDSNPLDGGWVTAGDATQDLKLVSNAVTGTVSPGQRNSAYYNSSLPSNQYSKAKVYGPGGGPTVRIQANQPYLEGYAFGVNNDNVTFVILRYSTTGSLTTLVSASDSLSPGDTLTLVADGTTIYGKKNDVAVPGLSVTDSMFISGYAGMYTYSTVSGLLDDWSAAGLSSSLSDGSCYSYYVRCEDTIGNKNTDDYEISFCVQQSGGSPGFVPRAPYGVGIKGTGLK